MSSQITLAVSNGIVVKIDDVLRQSGDRVPLLHELGVFFFEKVNMILEGLLRVGEAVDEYLTNSSVCRVGKILGLITDLFIKRIEFG